MWVEDCIVLVPVSMSRSMFMSVSMSIGEVVDVLVSRGTV